MRRELTTFDRPGFKFDLDFGEEVEKRFDASDQKLFQHGHVAPPELQPFRFLQRNTKSDYPDLFT